ncbi:TNT domain-containing protein [Kitasatospora sp. NPDC050543]|uniref:TNT domain-containing protein n=1 Tax=Kitasatospora sp. NPDC050543 TaxID=3364054 RepID=UPI00379D25AD
MKVRRILLATVAGVGLLTAAPPAQAAGAAAVTATATPPDQCSEADWHGDARLGPERLPVVGRVGQQLIDYQRTGGRPEQEFLAAFYDSSAGSWKYPPADGYVILNGKPIKVVQTLKPGLDIDRYGSEFGSFLAPEGLAYAKRSIPPQSLDNLAAPGGCNYHDYKVLKPFKVQAGPIAPWFNQPGWGWQYQLDATLVPGAPARINVGWLVTNGYLERLV